MECCLSVQVAPLPFNVDFIQVATDEVVMVLHGEVPIAKK